MLIQKACRSPSPIFKRHWGISEKCGFCFLFRFLLNTPRGGGWIDLGSMGWGSGPKRPRRARGRHACPRDSEAGELVKLCCARFSVHTRARARIGETPQQKPSSIFVFSVLVTLSCFPLPFLGGIRWLERPSCAVFQTGFTSWPVRVEGRCLLIFPILVDNRVRKHVCDPHAGARCHHRAHRTRGP